MTLVAQAFGFVLCAFIGLLAATIVIWIWQGKIDLSALLSEPTGQASMSRFQLLIFTFVIAVSLFAMVEAHMTFPDIPSGVLTLLGISASTYAVSKGITYSQPQAAAAATDDGAGSDADAAVAAAQAAASQAAVHAASAQQAVQQTADNAAKAQQAADQATGQ
jgi:hypothetical protein